MAIRIRTVPTCAPMEPERRRSNPCLRRLRTRSMTRPAFASEEFPFGTRPYSRPLKLRACNPARLGFHLLPLNCVCLAESSIMNFVRVFIQMRRREPKIDSRRDGQPDATRAALAIEKLARHDLLYICFWSSASPNTRFTETELWSIYMAFCAARE